MSVTRGKTCADGQFVQELPIQGRMCRRVVRRHRRAPQVVSKSALCVSSQQRRSLTGKTMASKALMELRVAMCQTGAGSAGVRCVRACTPPLALFRLFSRTSRRPANSSRFAPRREFLAKNYAAVKAACPKVPILVRESSGTPAKLTGVYGAQSLAPSRSRSPFFVRTFLSPTIVS